MDARRSFTLDPNPPLMTDLVGVAHYLADAVRHGVTPADEAVLALAGWAREELQAVVPAAYMVGDDDLAVDLLSRAAFDILGEVGVHVAD